MGIVKIVAGVGKLANQFWRQENVWGRYNIFGVVKVLKRDLKFWGVANILWIKYFHGIPKIIEKCKNYTCWLVDGL